MVYGGSYWLMLETHGPTVINTYPRIFKGKEPIEKAFIFWITNDTPVNGLFFADRG